MVSKLIRKLKNIKQRYQPKEEQLLLETPLTKSELMTVRKKLLDKTRMNSSLLKLGAIFIIMGGCAGELFDYQAEIVSEQKEMLSKQDIDIVKATQNYAVYVEKANDYLENELESGTGEYHNKLKEINQERYKYTETIRAYYAQVTKENFNINEYLNYKELLMDVYKNAPEMQVHVSLIQQSVKPNIALSLLASESKAPLNLLAGYEKELTTYKANIDEGIKENDKEKVEKNLQATEKQLHEIYSYLEKGMYEISSYYEEQTFNHLQNIRRASTELNIDYTYTTNMKELNTNIKENATHGESISVPDGQDAPTNEREFSIPK